MPDERRERSLPLNQFLGGAGIVDHHVALVALGDGSDVEAREGRAEVLALGEDRAPAQPGLEALQAQLLEQAPVVGDGKDPLAVVVGEELPGAPLHEQRGAPSGPYVGGEAGYRDYPFYRGDGARTRDLAIATE